MYISATCRLELKKRKNQQQQNKQTNKQTNNNNNNNNKKQFIKGTMSSDRRLSQHIEPSDSLVEPLQRKPVRNLDGSIHFFHSKQDKAK